MKEEILSIASDLRECSMTTNEAREHLLRLFGVVGQSEQLVLFARFISNNSKLTTWMTSDELLAEFKKQK